MNRKHLKFLNSFEFESAEQEARTFSEETAIRIISRAKFAETCRFAIAQPDVEPPASNHCLVSADCNLQFALRTSQSAQAIAVQLSSSFSFPFSFAKCRAKHRVKRVLPGAPCEYYSLRYTDGLNRRTILTSHTDKFSLVHTMNFKACMTIVISYSLNSSTVCH